MIIGHIGARKGSKGVVGKNSRVIAGKPLFEWSLDQLIQNKMVEKIAVSTDDEEIYQKSLEKGCLNIGLRPKELSGDMVSKWKVWQHSLTEIKKKTSKVDIFVDLDCTAPLRQEEDISNAIKLFLEKKPDMVISCCDAKKNPYFNLLELNKSGSLQVSKKTTNEIIARQQAPKVYEHAASTYVLLPSYLESSNSIYEGYVIPYEMPQERCLDIDSNLDFKIIEFLLMEKINAKNIK